MKRITFIASLLSGYKIVLDIGTDHGLVLKKALDLKYIQKGIASDIKPQPLFQAYQNLKKYPVEFYLSDGFSQIRSVFDLALICGMGSHTIINILKNQLYMERPLILGCQGKWLPLIYWLKQNDFEILNYYNFFDKFNYLFLKVIRKKKL
ncbi:tRNA (adenine(22)-N(1))-methyltransferase TrmK [Candidatus Phytoplasma phoenicium]|uniref:tRNA methyltransferase TrmK n=1 Tax=Candidatus Phytoplasma phoenicium TaxID=198422 RepID=A0A0L0MIX6_9MOLU|nr:tRNA (adenine(22)-N(1))-methyltransferase TrmK [Candidatus Phytoplasma phoenicium]KND62602.1 tRNA methyltransferase TrmK [Candidatus Phytoplasma phoenicium]